MTDTTPKPGYYLIGERVRARIRAVWSFSQHKTIVGGAVERALLEVLREMLPRQFEPLTGIVARSGGVPCERQIDVMIVDTQKYPVLMRDGDFAVVLPMSVRATIEVKSSVQDKKSIPLVDTLVQVALTSAEAFPTKPKASEKPKDLDEPKDRDERGTASATTSGGAIPRFCFFDDRRCTKATAVKKAIEKLSKDPDASNTEAQLEAALIAANSTLDAAKAEAKKKANAKKSDDSSGGESDDDDEEDTAVKAAQAKVSEAETALAKKRNFAVAVSQYLPTAVYASSGLRLLRSTAGSAYEIYTSKIEDEIERFCDALLSLVVAIIDSLCSHDPAIADAFKTCVRLDSKLEGPLVAELRETS